MATASAAPIDTGTDPASGLPLRNPNQADLGPGFGLPVKGEPSVLSTVSGAKNFSTYVQPKIDSANATVTAAADTRTEQQKLADWKSTHPTEQAIPADLLSDPAAAADITPEEKAYQDRLANYDKQKQDATDIYNNLTLANTASAKAQITNLTQQYNTRRTLLEQSNKANVGTWQQQFLRSGQAEYSPGMTGDFLSVKEQEGQAKVQDLDNEYNSKVAAINAALDSSNYAEAAKLTQELDTIEQNALSLMHDNAKEAAAVNKSIKDQQLQAVKDSAISGLVTQGIHDPNQILSLLNKYTGGNFTADEVSKTLKDLTVDGNPQNLPSDIATFKYIRDNFGLPESIANLPPEQQYFAYLQAVKQANTAPKAPGTGGYSALEQRKLRAAGIDPSDTKASDAYLYGTNGVKVPTWEEYLDAAQQISKESFGPELQDQLKQQYDAEFGQYQGGNKPQELTPSELKKLEAAGLLNASRKEQLKFLYSKDSTDPFSSGSAAGTDTAGLPDALR